METAGRYKKIENIVTLVGGDTSESTITFVGNMLEFIPTAYLQRFAEYLLKNYDRYKKPIINIISAGQEFEKRLRLEKIARDEFKFQTVQEVAVFLSEFFRGQKIANRVSGLYYAYVSISMDESGALWNDYAQKKLNSEESNNFIHWCFFNQKRIGDVQMLKNTAVVEMQLQQKEALEAPEDENINPEVKKLLSNVVQNTRIPSRQSDPKPRKKAGFDF